MENATYATLARQSGLMNELRLIANNIANATTTGYRSEDLMFSEFIADLGPRQESLSMAAARVRHTDMTQGGLSQTGGTFDLAIEGEGYFLVEGPNGPLMTRAGSFTPDVNGELVTMDGRRVLDAGGAPIFVPADAGQIGIAPDGTISAAGAPIGQVGLVVPDDPNAVTRQGGTLFNPNGGFAPAEGGRILQGFLEESNVNAISQISRMVEVQRAYELGQTFLDREDERIRGLIQAAVR